MLFVVLGLFVACRSPWHLADFVLNEAEHEHNHDPSSFEGDIVHHLSTLLVFCNSWATPVVYALFNDRIRQQVVELVLCRPCRHDLSPDSTEQQQQQRQQLGQQADIYHVVIHCQ